MGSATFISPLGQSHAHHLGLTERRLSLTNQAPNPQPLHRCCPSTGAYQENRRSPTSLTATGDLFKVILLFRFWWGPLNPRKLRCLSTRMSCLPSPDGVATNIGCIRGSDSFGNQICGQQSRDDLCSDSVEEGLTLYCRPVILYGIIQRRAKQNPSFLPRGLRYKIHAKRRKRIQITITLSGSTNAELEAQNIFPLYALFARPISATLVEGHSPLYQFSQACLLTSFNKSGSNNNTEATFIIPDLTTLDTSRACSLNIILVSRGQVGQTLDKINCLEDIVESSSLQKLEGKCFWGKIPIGFLSSSLKNCVDLSLGRTNKFASTIIMSPGFIEPKFVEQNSCLAFCSLTEDFTCPFCLAKCGSFTGLEYHLVSSHDLFNFHFMVSNKYQCVNVSLKYRTRKNELFPEAVDPRHARFSYFSKYRKPGGFITATEMIVPSNATEMIFASNATEMVRHGHIFTIGSKSVEDAQGYFEDGHVHKENGISVPDVSIDPAQSLHGGNLSPPRVLQFGKTRKLSVDRFDPRNRQLLQKHQFFHSHKGEQMTFEEVLSDHDSEDEVDDDVADFEDRRMLDSYSDIAKDEKHIMHMWNSFVRRQRVLTDGHIPWACKAFSRLHGQLFIQNPSLRWCWRLLMIKLWNHNLLDARTMDTCNIARTMDTCNIILDGLKNEGVDPK